MIFDCFPFFNELDLLELRLETLWNHVDKFVLVEAEWTHSNREKALYFEKNKERFAKYLDKITHIIVRDKPGNTGSWSLEHYQRDCIVRGLGTCKNTDIVFISDLDEIPNPKYFDRLEKLDKYNSVIYRSELFYYKFNVRERQEQRLELHSPKAIYYSALERSTPDKIRRSFDGFIVDHGAWHFSYLGNTETIIQKIQAFCHQEYNRSEFLDAATIDERIRQNADLFGRGLGFETIPLTDSYFPTYLIENRERFAPYII